MKRVLLILAATALAGCASSSGVYSVGPDTYRVSTAAFTSMGGQGAAQNAAIKAATASCGAKGKALQVVDEGGSVKVTGANVAVTFRCVD